MIVHFIAIGGSAMHNLALALHQKGFSVTGSDDEIFEPSKSRLLTYGLLPESFGWFPEKITNKIDAVILGMHAREDNPELIKARELGLPVFSYPEYIFEQSKKKTRVVIGGSHGKTTITSMIMHVLNFHKKHFDYMVGAQVDGFETMVRLSEEAEIIVIEGDEYLSSPIDPRPKFHLYKPHIALISGVAWDHINVFPTFEIYVDQFRKFASLIEPGGVLIYFDNDPVLTGIASSLPDGIKKSPYNSHKATTKNGITSLLSGSEEIRLQIFGDHNLQNIQGAKQVCSLLGISDKQFYSAIKEFRGASKRLQLLGQNETSNVYLDFAHAPSKLKATTAAVKAQFPDRELIACMELHTFSSLKKEFLPQFRNTMENADQAFVYFNPHTIEHKKLEYISADQVKQAFGGNVRVFTNSALLIQAVLEIKPMNKTLLLMSSGNFDGLNLSEIAKKFVSA